MISDEERRRVAQNLRSSRYRLKPVPSGKQFMSMIRAASELELAHEMNYLTQSGFERLADLIDRPTCRKIIPDEMECLVFCSNCGAEIGEYGVPNYCHNCGAEVIE